VERKRLLSATILQNVDFRENETVVWKCELALPLSVVISLKDYRGKVRFCGNNVVARHNGPRPRACDCACSVSSYGDYICVLRGEHIIFLYFLVQLARLLPSACSARPAVPVVEEKFGRTRKWLHRFLQPMLSPCLRIHNRHQCKVSTLSLSMQILLLAMIMNFMVFTYM
jgi:hypothetical protein